MNNKRATKRSLLTSITALVMCVAMLVGTTFAWFTDTASTGVNKIQAGNLDVQLLDASDNSLEGKILSWVKADGHSGEAVLWEPGCTYDLESFKIKNNGNLALKYEVKITGITGDAKLLKAIDFTVAVATSSEDTTAPTNATLNSFNGTLAAGTETGKITITGKMKTEAGNEYQGLTIDGISITVYATQLSSEFDSNGSDYDADAEYNYKSATIMSETDGKTLTLESGKTYTVGAATVSVDAGGNITYKNDTSTAQTVTITTDGGTLTVNAPTDTVDHYGNIDNVNIEAVASASYHEFGKVDILEIKKGRVVVENGNNVAVLQVKPAGNEVPVVAVPQSEVLETKLQVDTGKEVEVAVIDNGGQKIENESFKIAQTGTEVSKDIPEELVKVLNKNEDGKVTLEEPKNYVAMIGTTPYESFAAAVNAVKDGETIKLTDNTEVNSNDYNVNSRLKVEKNGVTINLNDKTLTVPNYTLILDGNNITLKNGEMKTTTTDSSQTYGSYAVVPWGKNITITGVKMLGGVNVTGDNNGGESNATVTITDCEITATNYYTVCAQCNAEVTVENSKLIFGKFAFFWAAQKGYSEGNDPVETVSSKIFYDSKTVTFEGEGALYNPVGVAVVAENLTIKDAEGKEQTIDAVAVSTEAHLRTLVAAGENVILASDITLSAPITIGTTSTNNTTIAIVGNGHKLDGSKISNSDNKTNNPRTINVWDGTNMTVILKDLTVVGPEAPYGRGITTGDTNGLTLILDDCEISASYYAINVYEDEKNVYNPEIIVRNTTLKNVSGYCAINIWAVGTKATFENSTLIGVNRWSGTSDDFATIVLVNNAKNSTLTFTNCTIKAVEEGTADEALFDARATGANVTFEGCKFFLNDKELTGDAVTNEMSVLTGTNLTIK